MANTPNSSPISTKPTLSEKQQLLLSRFHDGECSCFSALYVRRLLNKNPSAQHFLSDLEALRSQCAKLTDAVAGVDLWARIDTRIEQEKRAELYLGARSTQATQRSLLQRIDLKHAAFGGLSGAAIAAGILMVLARPQQILTFSAPSAGPVAQNQLIQPAGITNHNNQRGLYHIDPIKKHRAIEAALEVDWMRANGSLKLIPDPDGSSAIIWVRPRSLAAITRKLPPQIKPTPLGLSREPAPGLGSALGRQERYHRENSALQGVR